MPEIDNYQVYNDRMRRSMWDKAFFMDKVPGTELILDYGCADGSLIRFLSEIFPAMHFIGFDIDPVMVEKANADRRENTRFYSTMPELLEGIRESGIPGEQITIYFSSVFHEVFHYGFDLSMLKELIRRISPQYLVVRDMMYQSGTDEAMVSAEAEERVRESIPAAQIRDFEEIWGSIRLRRQMVHLLLKYHYTENWPRECAENYFSYTDRELMEVLDPDGCYRRIFYSRYILPWIRYDVEQNLGIDLGEDFTTHYTLILSRKTLRRILL
ncbi:MAG: methyltransferase domain-containing protein [Firmicutes bacterium]|nr:methyltransferase domain-containing protein [Bacillota bacterium]